MKKVFLAILILTSVCCYALPLPKIYLPFEQTDGFFDEWDPAWINRAPLPDPNGQLWFAERGKLSANANVPGELPVIATGIGVNGSDCMDLTNTNSSQQNGSLYYGKLANTADGWFANTPAEDAFDDAMSVTITGWFNTAGPNAIGVDDQYQARLMRKYGQFTILCNQGRFGVNIGNGADWVYSDWGSYAAEEHKGQWVFFAITYDGTIPSGDNMKFYVGTPQSVASQVSQGSTGTVRGALTWSPGQYLIVGNSGIGSVHGNASFKGYLDNIRVFSSYDDSSGALGLNDIELYRQIDLGITPADDSVIYYSGDINQDYEVGMEDLEILSLQWLDDTIPSPVNPAVHLTFDGTDGKPFDENDPAFANQGTAGTGELPSMIMRIPSSDPNYSDYSDNDYISLEVNPDGVKGGALDLTSRPMSSLASMLVYGNTDSSGTDTAIQQALDWPLSLTFTCWWKHSHPGPIIEDTALEEGAFLLHRIGELSFWANNRVEPDSGGFFGEMAFTPNDEDQFSGNMVFSPWIYPETDEWVFFAFTLDMLLDETDPAVGRIKWYRGTIDQPVTLHTQVQFDLDEILAPPTGSPLVIGNSSYLEAEALDNFSALIDELRLYSNMSDSSAALSVTQLEDIRKNDAQAYITKQADTDKDSDVDYDDFQDLAMHWLESKTPFEMLPFDPSNAVLYFSFEGDNGSYGAGSEGNPAWEDKVSGINPNYILSTSAPTWPEITSNGIKGDALYASDPSKTGMGTMTLNWTNSVKDAFSNVQSYTVTGWINTRDVNQNGSDSYLLRGLTGGPEVKWRGDGRLQVKDTVDGTWRYANWGEGYSNGNWVFFAITRDDSSIRYYFGDENNAVTAGYAETGLTLSATAVNDRFIIGGRTYNGNDNYLNCDMDELRVFRGVADNSGALTLEQIEDIRKYDLGL